MSRGTRDVKAIVGYQRHGSVPAVLAAQSSLGGGGTSHHPTQQQHAHGTHDPNREADHLVDILKTKVQRQKEELDTRTDSINAIQRNFERLSRLYADDKTEFDKLKEKFVQAMAEIEDLRAQLKLNSVVRIEFERTNERFFNFRTMSSQLLEKLIGSQMDSLLEVNSDFKERLVELSGAHLTELAGKNEMIESLQTAVMDLQTTNEQLQNHLQTTSSESERARTSLEDELHLLRKQVETVTKQLNGAKMDNEGLRNELRQNQETLDRVRTENEQHLKTIESLCNDLKGRQDALASLHGDWTHADEAWKSAKIALETKIASLHTELTIMRTDHERVLTALTAENKTLLVEKSKFQEDALRLQSELAELKSERDLLKIDGRDHAELSETLKSQLISLQRDLQNLNREKMALITDRDALKAEKVSQFEMIAKLQKAGARKSSLDAEQQTRFEGLVRELTAEKDRACAAEKVASEQLKTTLEQLNRLQNKHENLQVELARLQADYKAIIPSKERVDQIQNEMDELRTRYLVLQADYDSLMVTKDGMAHVMTETAVRNDALQEKLSATETLLHKLRAELETKIKGLQDENGRLQQQARDLTLQLESEHSRSLELESQLAGAKLTAARLHEMEIQANADAATIHRLEQLQHEKDTRLEAGMKRLRALRSAAEGAAMKLITAEEACESGYTCHECMSIFTKPVTCVPCGHTFCSGCINATNMRTGMHFCPECKSYSATAVIGADTLDLLSGKFIYRKQVLKDLLAEMKRT